MEKIVLEQFGPVTHFSAADVVDNKGRIGAYIAEPEARNDGDGCQSETWDEAAFRTAVEAHVSSWEPRSTGEQVWIQFDPDRDNAESVRVMLKG